MADKRKDDTHTYNQFRRDRFVQDQCQWYFLTREGTVEGPYESKVQAMEHLDLYAKVMSANLIEAELKNA